MEILRVYETDEVDPHDESQLAVYINADVLIGGQKRRVMLAPEDYTGLNAQQIKEKLLDRARRKFGEGAPSPERDRDDIYEPPARKARKRRKRNANNIPRLLEYVNDLEDRITEIEKRLGL